MSVVIDIQQHFRTCGNCRWCNGTGICQRPGGWHFDSRFRHCATFERRDALFSLTEQEIEKDGST